MNFSKSEIAFLERDPEALRILSEYHDMQATMGEAMGFDCSGNDRRKAELLDEANRLERMA